MLWWEGHDSTPLQTTTNSGKIQTGGGRKMFQLGDVFLIVCDRHVCSLVILFNLYFLMSIQSLSQTVRRLTCQEHEPFTKGHDRNRSILKINKDNLP